MYFCIIKTHEHEFISFIPLICQLDQRRYRYDGCIRISYCRPYRRSNDVSQNRSQKREEFIAISFLFLPQPILFVVGWGFLLNLI